MRHDDFLKAVATTLEQNGYDVCIGGFKTGWKKLFDKYVRHTNEDAWRKLNEKPENLAWAELCNACSIRRRHPDIVAVKRKDEVILLECKVSQSKEAGELVRQLADDCEMAYQISKWFKTVRVVLALDINTERIELWWIKHLTNPE